MKADSHSYFSTNTKDEIELDSPSHIRGRLYCLGDSPEEKVGTNYLTAKKQIIDR